MIALLGRAPLFVLVGLAVVVLGVWVASGDFIEGLRTVGEPGGGPLGSLADAAGRVGSLALGAGALALLALAPVGAVLGVSRALARRRRRYVRLTIVPSRDEATPARVQDLYEALHQRLEERWYRRLPLGQPSVTLGLQQAQRLASLLPQSTQQRDDEERAGHQQGAGRRHPRRPGG